jgi:hypothetical protein
MAVFHALSLKLDIYPKVSVIYNLCRVKTGLRAPKILSAFVGCCIMFSDRTGFCVGTHANILLFWY